MDRPLVWMLDDEWASHEVERSLLEESGFEFVVSRSHEFQRDFPKYAPQAEGILLQVSFNLLSGDCIHSLERCKIISVTGGGYNNVDLEAASGKGIYVTFVPGYCADEVSDHAITLLLALSRRIPQYQRLASSGRWEATALKGLSRLKGQTLGLIGFGRIARKVAMKAKVHGLEVLAYDPYVPKTVMEREGVRPSEFEDLLRRSDFISIHVLLTAETRRMIDERAISLMKPTAFIINTCRGAVIDEPALIKALREKRIAGAGLDVLEEEPPSLDNPLLFMENVVVTPHSAYISEEALLELKTRATRNVILALTGQMPQDVVNLEALGLRRETVRALDQSGASGAGGGQWLNLARRQALDLPEYVPEKPAAEVVRELGLEHITSMDCNETLAGPSPLSLEAVVRELPNANLYPDGDSSALRTALAGHLGVTPGMIVVGNGADNIITMLGQAFLNEGDEVILAHPTFPVYETVVTLFGGRLRKVPLRDHVHDLDGMKRQVSGRTKMVVICNPNNPTGTIVTRSDLERFFEDLPSDLVVVLDEAYCDYVEDDSYPSSIDYIRLGYKVIGVRTFSKIAGLAGLRVGYTISAEEAASLLQRVREPFPVNWAGQVAALASLDDSEHRSRVLAINREGKAYLEGEFRRLGIEYVPTQTNFVFVNVGVDGQVAHAELLKRGFRVRASKAWGYPTWIRATIGTMEQNKAFVVALEEVLKGAAALGYGS